MAIEKTVFTATSLANNGPEVLAFLQANASEYFDSITLNERGSVVCTADDVDVLVIGFGQETTTMQLMNGATISNSSATGTYGSQIFRYGYKTQNGVMLAVDGGETLIITKSDNDSTALIAGLRTSNSASNTHRVCMGDVSRNSVWYDIGSGAGNASEERKKYVINANAALTALMPLPLGDGGTYSPDLYVTVWAENGGLANPKKLIADGTEYIYDGAFALKG